VVEVEYSRLALRDDALDVSLLDDAERARAARFVPADARSRFVQVRSALRTELSRRLGVAPREVRFTYGQSGKPGLASPFDESRIEFSVAHSRKLALLAFAEAVAIGVDLEHVRPLRDPDGLARRVLSEHEYARLSRMSGRERTAAFFRLWARKEALVKCFGGSILVPLAEEESVGIVEVPVPDGYVAAVCAAVPDVSLIERPLYSAR
jgi:4'-phosphopantetheinyl transferase